MAKMKAYADFDEYLEDQSVKNQEIVRALRTFVQRVEPGLREAVKWGNGCWIGTNGPELVEVFARETEAGQDRTNPELTSHPDHPHGAGHLRLRLRLDKGPIPGWNAGCLP